jgi:hypothetical protein
MAEKDKEQTEEFKYKGEAEATASEKKAAGGEKTMTIENHLFQSDDDCQDMAETLLARLKDRKHYFRFNSEFCPVPLELNDLIQTQERITKLENLSYPYYGDSGYKFGDSTRKFRSNGVVIPYFGKVRDIKLSVTPIEQKLTIVMEVKDE